MVISDQQILENAKKKQKGFDQLGMMVFNQRVWKKYQASANSMDAVSEWLQNVFCEDMS